MPVFPRVEGVSALDIVVGEEDTTRRWAVLDIVVFGVILSR